MSRADVLRMVLARLSQNGQNVFTLAALEFAPELAALNPKELKEDIAWLKRRKEMIVDDRAQVTYQPKRPRAPKANESIYRVVRDYKGAFTALDISQLAETNLNTTKECLRVWAETGHIKKVGLSGGYHQYLLTALGRNSTRPPVVNVKKGDYQDAKQAVIRLSELMMMENLGTKSTRRDIVAQAKIIENSFKEA